MQIEQKTSDQTQIPAVKKRGLNKNKYLSDYETQHLEKILRASIRLQQRDCLLLFMALKTGARAQEVLNLKVSDLNPSNQTVFFKGMKNSKDRELPIPPFLFRSLMSYARKQKRKKIFNISYNRFRQIWEEYRPVYKKLHALRHTFAINLFKKTRDLRLVQMALGHKSITNTMIYADYVYSQDELKRLIL